jgi:hypothetical protein
MTNRHPTLNDIRQARIRAARAIEPPTKDDLQHIASAAQPLPPSLGNLIQSPRVGDPRPGEIWRAGRSEAVLVWVRRVFDDGVADVVPLVLDVELADADTLLLGPEITPLDAPLAAMVALRTHIDLGAFINRIGAADVADAVTEVMAAAREGRPAKGVHVGLPILDDADRRIEYRCAVRDILSELPPEAWAARSAGDQ